MAALGIDVVFANISHDQDLLADALARYDNIVIATETGDSVHVATPLDIYKDVTW